MGGRTPQRAWTWREVRVPASGAGMRLDRFLAARFRDRSRTELARGIRHGLVTDADDRPLQKSTTVRAEQVLRVWIPGLAPAGPPPPLPPILHEDDRVMVLDKPPRMPCHPGGSEFTWAVVGLARDARPDHEVDLVHRLDQDTTGVLVLAKDREANAWLKRAFREGEVDKEYVALCRGRVPWDHRLIEAPIGPADGPIRIQMAVTDDGLPSTTEVRVEARHPEVPMTRVRVVLHTGRTHQIRVHLDHVGHSLIGDRMYGVPPGVFLHYWEQGLDATAIRRAGAPRHALHAARIELPHPDGGRVGVRAPLPSDLARWWADPAVLPFDDES